MAYRVDAAWDEAARVWIATSDDVPSLCVEATSLDALIEVVLDLMPNLYESPATMFCDFFAGQA
jgi:hypothetical protein